MAGGGSGDGMTEPARGQGRSGGRWLLYGSPLADAHTAREWQMPRARGLILALFLLTCGACRMASLPHGESAAAAQSDRITRPPGPGWPHRGTRLCSASWGDTSSARMAASSCSAESTSAATQGPPFPTPDDPVRSTG